VVVEPVGIVGLGASAGGIEAARTFFEAVPPTSGFAYVLVQHLDPSHPSRLAEALAGSTRMLVREVVDGEAVKANRVYVIPPGVTMRLADGVLRLKPRGHGRAMPIDEF